MDERSPDSRSESPRYLTQAQVLSRWHISRPTFWRLRQQYPELRPIRLTGRLSRWDERVLERWLDGRRNGDVRSA